MKKKDEFLPQENKLEKNPQETEEKERDKEGECPEVKRSEKKEDIKKLQQELELVKDKWLRTAAELENYKKRLLKEKEEIVKYALVDLMKGILPLLDHFDKAMENLPPEKGEFERGIEIIFKEMYNILSRYGLTKIDKLKGTLFDPFEQEAIGYEESKEIPEGKVIEVLRAGYKFKDRLIRPALVKVSRGKKDRSEASKKNEENNDKQVEESDH